LAVKKSSSGYNRESLVRFSLSPLSGDVQSAKLRLFGSASSTDRVPVVARLLRDGSFSEGATTYSTKPEPLPIELARAFVTGATPTWYELDVTSLVREKMREGATSIELLLHSLVATTSL